MVRRMVNPELAGGEIRAFLIADIRGYTSFTVEHGDEAAARLAGAFAKVMEEAGVAVGGQLLELRGDEALLTFSSSRQALRAALSAQRVCLEHSLHDPSLPIRVGIGIDAGEAVSVLSGYRGRALNLAARLCSLAGVGETLVSEAIVHLAGHMDGVEFEERGQVQLKGFEDPITVLAVRSPEPKKSASPAAVELSTPSTRLPIGAFLGALPSSPLVGREEEFAALTAEIGEVVASRGRLVLLAGEPGAGKTRLTQEVFLATRNQGFILSVGSCLENRQAVPYYPFFDVLSSLALAATASGRPDPFQRRTQLRTLLGDEGDGNDGGSGGQAEQERLRREIGSFLIELAGIRPLALFLDDLHWADESTLDLIHHLARRVRTDPILLVGTYRDVEVGRQHPLQRVLRDLRRDELARTITVRRLTEPGTSALMAATFGQEEISAEFAGLVHSQTEGNPFFIQQVCRALVERGDVYRDGNGRWDRRKLTEIELPESIRSTIGERVSRLSASTQEVLAVAAVLGQPFRFTDLLAMVEQEEDALEESLREAMAIGLLRSPDGDLYSFDHALSVQTLLTEIPHRRRRRLHSNAARVLAAAGDETRAAEIALHFSEGDEAPEAARWSLTAAERARRVFAHHEAEHHSRSAAELAVECEDPDLAATARAGQGESLLALGRLEDAVAALLPAASHFRSAGEIEAEARVLALLGRVRREMMNPQPSIDLINEFLERSAGLGAEPLSLVLSELGRLYWTLGNYDQMIGPATRGAELAVAAGNVGLRIQNDIVLAHWLQHDGNLEGTRDLLVRAYADSAGVTGLLDRATIANNLAFIQFVLGEFEQNLFYRTRALELAEQLGHSSSLCFAHTMVGQANAYVGRMAAAEESLGRANAALAGLELQRARNYLLTETAHLKLIRGDLSGFEDLVAEFDLAEVDNDLQLQTWLVAMRGDVLTLAGRAAEAVPMLRRQAAICRRTRHHPGTVLVPLASALTDQGEIDEALEIAREAMASARSERDGLVMMDAGRCLGVILSSAKQWEAADAAFAETEDRAERAPYPYLLNWARLDRARSLAARGNPELARVVAASAAAGLDELGSLLLLGQAQEIAGPLPLS